MYLLKEEAQKVESIVRGAQLPAQTAAARILGRWTKLWASFSPLCQPLTWVSWQSCLPSHLVLISSAAAPAPPLLPVPPPLLFGHLSPEAHWTVHLIFAASQVCHSTSRPTAVPSKLHGTGPIPNIKLTSPFSLVPFLL